MIPTLIFIIITFVIIILGGYLFLVGQDGKIPYADMLVCVIGIFLSIYLAIQSAAGNVGDIVALEVNQTLEYVPIQMIDATVSYLYILCTILFIGCLAFGIIQIIRSKKYEDSL